MATRPAQARDRQRGAMIRAIAALGLMAMMLAAPGAVLAQEASRRPLQRRPRSHRWPRKRRPRPRPRLRRGLGRSGRGLTRARRGLAQAEASPAPASPATGIDAAYEPPHDQPGPAAERLLYNAFYVDQAPLDIQAGNMDLYLFGLKTEAAQELADAEGVELIQAPATTLSLILNPAPAPEGELNPFSIPEVRQAMQYLVDRDSIANDIYRGAAVPMVTHVARSTTTS